MCGIAGVLDPAGGSVLSLRQATDCLHHRGPDDGGLWTSADGRVGLGHRRLAIIDLSPTGHQPMASATGRYNIVFNGEVYNFERLRQELGPSSGPYRGSSDTEVMLAAMERWGVAAAIPRFEGMFALAVWDSVAGDLTLARDRLGKKPLYYGKDGDRFLFGSELKSLRAAWKGNPPLDVAARDSYLHLAYVPAPATIYEGIRKLPPGSFLPVNPGRPLGEPTQYWSALQAAAQPRKEGLDPAQAVHHLEELLDAAVQDRMVSDVPIGAFLSGGVDSSAVVALMAKASAQPVRTFTIAWEDASYDESAHARAVAQHLGTHHTEQTVTPDDVVRVLGRLADVYDEPFADASQVPTLLVSETARRHVTVALSGDGGDEAFGGYTRYTHAAALWRRLHRIPQPVRRAVGATAGMVPVPVVNALGRALRPVLPAFLRQNLLGDKLRKATRLAEARSREDVYVALTTTGWPVGLAPRPRPDPGLPFQEWMMLADTRGYLTDDILVKVDRASMSVGLETRAPLLDHRVVEFAWRLPLEFRIRGMTTKWILRQVLDRHVPRSLIDRPKMGFGIPIGPWLRGPLRLWGEGLLDPSRVRASGLDVQTVERLWQQHQSGSRDWSSALWAVLMYRAWWDRWVG